MKSWRTRPPRSRLSPEHRRLLLFLIILAGIFVYLNWKWGAFIEQGTARGGDAEDAILVQAPAAPAPRQAAPETVRDFYVEARLERERVRSEQMQALREVLADERAAAEARAEAQREMLALTRRAGREAEAESLIKAKGYRDALVFLNERGAVAVVRAARLTPSDTARIADAVAGATGVGFAEIRVIPYDR